MNWTRENIERMKALKSKGYSASQIGKILGTSRNSVIGKLHRLPKAENLTVPSVRKPYLSDLSWSSWSTPRYREE